MKVELFSFLSMAVQVSLASVSRIALISIDTAFLGHLNTNVLAAAALAGMWTAVPLNIVWSMTSTLITLCGQAWGAKNYALVGIWFQMALFLVTTLHVFVFGWYWSIEIVLTHVTDNDDIVVLGARFTRLLSFHIWPFLVYACMRQYLQAIGIVYPTTIVGLLSIALALLANMFLIYGYGTTWTGLGFDGALPWQQSLRLGFNPSPYFPMRSSTVATADKRGHRWLFLRLQKNAGSPFLQWQYPWD